MDLYDMNHEGAMSQPSDHNKGGAPSEDQDVNMEDMNEVSEALPAEEEAPCEPSDEASKEAEDRLRLELYTNMFKGQVVELRNLKSPPECSQHPEQAQDILKAYLAHTTFAVKVWTNFDADEKVFHDGIRAKDCGKLRLSKAKHDWLSSQDPKTFHLQHVRFDIGTPFRTLAQMHFHVTEGTGLKASGNMKHNEGVGRLPMLRDYLQDCLDSFNESGTRCQRLSMVDLEGAALAFRRDKKDDEFGLWELPKYGGGEWAGVEPPMRGGFKHR